MTLSDFTGRKIIILLGLLTQAFINILILVFPWFDFLFVYSFFLGMKMPMSCHLSFILLGEFVSQKHRGVFSTLNNGFDGLNNIWISFYLQYVGVWQYWYIGNIVELLIVFLLILFFIPKSPRNLLARKKYSEARQVFSRIAKINKKPMFHEKIIGEITGSELSSSPPLARKSTCCDLFKQSKREVVLLFVVPILWLAGDITSYGIQYGLNHLSGSLYTNGKLLGVADFCACFSVGLISNCWGRKPAIMIMWFLAALGCISYHFLKDYSTWGYVCVTVGRFGSNAAFAMMFLITTETFPTAFRGTMYAISNACARVGGIVAPLIPSFMPSFMLFEGIVAAVSLALSFALIETKGRAMKDEVNTRVPMSKSEDD